MRSSILAVAVVIAVVASACGGSVDGVAGDSAQAPTTTLATTTTTTMQSAPTTTIGATTTTSGGIPTSPVVPGADEDVDAIVEAYLVVFDSTTSYDEKAPYVQDFDGLEDTVVAYAEAGEAVGGIALSADEVGIEGPDARVIYSFLFAGNPAYKNLEGEAVLTEDGWQISRDFFCDIMTSARVGCP